GFVARLEDLYARNRNGKVVLSVPAKCGVLPPAAVTDPQQDWVAMASSGGRMLLSPVRELPVLARGKGLKILQIPPARLKEREEFAVGMTVLGPDDALLVYSGKRTLTLKPKDLEAYRGE